MTKQEWNDPYNPFNSFKALMWREWFEGMAKGEFLPPVSVDTDPCYACQNDCVYCNAWQLFKDGGMIPPEHLLRLADFYAEWGVKSTCIAGGGEPLLNPGLAEFLRRLSILGIESGVITNGVHMPIVETIAMATYCRWVGMSLDAGTPQTYAKLKGHNRFDCVVNNITRLTTCRWPESHCDVAVKYLIHPDNAHEIAQAAKLAKDAGAVHFHARPVGWDNVPKTAGKPALDWASAATIVDEQMAEARELEDGKFQVFGVRHKFAPGLSRKVGFSQCRAAPLILTFGADGNTHLCFDMRGKPELVLCSHYPDPREVLKHWNTDRHRAMLAAIDPQTCPRCTLGPYNEMVEQVFIEDKMCRFFP